ncbi:MAG: hypothetical protein LBM25_00205 [Bacteroidales bacterium]|jgi:hypothetical protein|nr:hypothetical protein [Bacteroidales bacterium]
MMRKLIKTIFLALFVAVLFTSNAYCQKGNFKGIIKYSISWEGSVGPNAPTTWEMKVYDEQTSFTDMFAGFPMLTNAKNNTTYMLVDFSQVPVEGVTGKWFVKSKMTEEDFSKITYTILPDTKLLAGKTVKKVHCVVKKDDGTEDEEDIWMCDEIGPTKDVHYYPGLKGMPFEFYLEQDEIKATFTATEIIPGGKVEEVDMLVPSGYEEVSEDEFMEIFSTLMEYIQELTGGGGDI